MKGKRPFDSAAGVALAIMSEFAVEVTAKSFPPGSHAMVIVTTPNGDAHMAPTMSREQVRALIRRRLGDTYPGNSMPVQGTDGDGDAE